VQLTRPNVALWHTPRINRRQRYLEPEIGIGQSSGILPLDGDQGSHLVSLSTFFCFGEPVEWPRQIPAPYVGDGTLAAVPR
jgi:hypothetical protein